MYSCKRDRVWWIENIDKILADFYNILIIIKIIQKN